MSQRMRGFLSYLRGKSQHVRNKLVIKVVETKTRTMIDKCLELTAYDALLQDYVDVWNELN